MAFDDDYKELEKPKGVKKQPNPSMFDSSSPKISNEELRQNAAEADDRSVDHRIKASKLASNFKILLEDKTISQNRNPKMDEIEKKLVEEMAQLAININLDENEIEGMGSLGWITLLLRVALIQKTRINDLEYKISLLENGNAGKIRIAT